jgi:hypothetical protein
LAIRLGFSFQALHPASLKTMLRITQFINPGECDMIRTRWRKGAIGIVLFLSGLTGCATVDVDSANYRATILYFEGGTGEIRQGNPNMLINRCSVRFRQEGIIVDYMDVRHDRSPKGVLTRVTDEHFRKIQQKVDSLREDGHRKIWLMGISNGTLSVMYAGERQVKGVEGLIIINPRRDMYSPSDKDGVYAKFSDITLPVLVIAHAQDNSNMKNLNKELVSQIFRKSPKAEAVALSGGVVGSGPEATYLTQKYQHGLRGLEAELVQTVVRCIDDTTVSMK